MNENDFKETLRKYYGGWRKRLDEVLVSVEVMSKHFESPELADDVSAALTEVDRLKNLSVAELAAENQSVMDYCKHWEERVEKAETERDKLRGLLKETMPYVEAHATFPLGPRDVRDLFEKLSVEFKGE